MMLDDRVYCEGKGRRGMTHALGESSLEGPKSRREDAFVGVFSPEYGGGSIVV